MSSTHMDLFTLSLIKAAFSDMLADFVESNGENVDDAEFSINDSVGVYINGNYAGAGIVMGVNYVSEDDGFEYAVTNFETLLWEWQLRPRSK